MFQRKKEVKITDRQYELLKMFSNIGTTKKVCTIRTTHQELSDKLGISRQALSIHLRRLKREGLIRTGRGFLDLTDKALEFLEKKTGEAYIIIKSNKRERKKVLDEVLKLPMEKICRVAGDSDVIVKIDRSKLDDALNMIDGVKGIQELTTHIVLECKWE